VLRTQVEDEQALIRKDSHDQQMNRFLCKWGSGTFFRLEVWLVHINRSIRFSENGVECLNKLSECVRESWIGLFSLR
jgi:hypothetical protein